MVSIRKITAIAKKNLQILMKDKRTVGLLIGMPILMMVLFGYAFGQTVKHVPIKIVNFDIGGPGIPMRNINDTEFSEIGIKFLDEDERVDITILDATTINLTKEIDQVYGGEGCYALVVFPENFTELMPINSVQLNITIYLDGSDTMTIGSIQSALAEMIGEILNYVSGGVGPHLQIQTEYVAGSPDLRPIDTMGAGILSFALLLFMILTVTGGFTKERITGTIYRVLATPTTKTDIILGYMLGNSLIALVQSSLLLIIGILLFNINVQGNIFLLFTILFVYAVSCVGIGIFASAFAENELQAFQFIPIILIPSMFFSGFLFPLNSFPKIFQYLSYIIPMTYSIRISRAIMINGFGFEMIWKDFSILLAITIIMVILATVVFRKKK
jgi:ABC-2 type transport system permease protein